MITKSYRYFEGKSVYCVRGVLSPLLGNVYLHYVLDQWFETEVTSLGLTLKPRLQGKATLIRYADDLIIGFEHEDDARRVVAVLEKRLGRFGLTLHPDKTDCCHFGDRQRGSRAVKVRPPLTS
jgi:hypothetical protein